jgi:murein endopeptidase
LRERKSRRVIDCRDFVFDAVNLWNNKLEGAFYKQVLSGNPLILKTDISGRAVVDSLVASQIASTYIVTASLAAASAIRDTVNLTVAVLGLELLPESQNYVRVGGTCEHHGLRDDTQYQNCRDPDNNHWGTNRLVQAIQAIAYAYDSLHPGVRLRVNDMSLPFGGLFDVDGNWRPEHKEHRVGINADYSLVCRDSLDNAVVLKEKDFKKIVWDKTKTKPFRHYPPDPPHYHVYAKEN